MQLSLFHPLGAMSHRANEGGPETLKSNLLEYLKEKQ
jgi:hypothetical protein